MDARGVPLSFIVTGAHRHDVSQLEPVLAALMVKIPSPPVRRHKHLCADAAYGGKPALSLMEREGYIAHVKSRQQGSRRTQARRMQQAPALGGGSSA